MKKSPLLIALMLAALAGGPTLAPVTAEADPGWAGHDRGPRCDHRLQRMAEVLGLSAEQQSQIQAIIQDERETVAPLEEKLQASRQELRAATQAENFDETAVRSIAAGQAATRTEMIVARARMQNRIHAILTPEQRAQAEKLRPLLHEGRGHRGRDFGPDGPDL